MPASADLLYVTSFQRGELLVFDLSSGRRIGALKVEDKAGIIGFEPSGDGRRLYVVDGTSRLRVFEVGSWRVLHSASFEDRALMLGGPPVTHLLDDRWLLINTYDYGAAAAGVRVFDTTSMSFRPVGLRVSPTPRAFVGDWAVSGNQAFQLSSDGPDLFSGSRVTLPMEEIGSLAALGDTLYALEFGGRPAWRLAVVSGGKVLRVLDLLRLLSPPEDPRGGTASLAVSSAWVAVQRGARVWLLDRASLTLKRTVDLPAPGDALAFSGSSLLVFASGGRVLSVPLGGGAPSEILKGLIAGSGPPLQIRVGTGPAAPRAERSPGLGLPPIRSRQTRIPRHY